MKKRSGLNVLKGHAWLAMSVAVLALGLSNEQMVNAEETESAATSNVEEAANQDSTTSSNDATSRTEAGEEANSNSGTATQALLPSQVRNMDASSKEEVTVEGYIAGTMKSPTSVATSNFENTNIVLADTYIEGEEVDASRVLPIQLPSGTLRETYNLVDNPELLGKKVRMKGRLDKYFGGTGIKDREATIDVIADADNQTPATDTPAVELPVANESNLTINQVRNSETGTTVATSGKIISPINAWGGQGFYIQDSAGDGIFVYPRTALGYKMGDTIQLTGTLSEYNKELQIIDITAHEQVKDVQVPEPTATTITAVNDGQNAAQMGTLITLSNVTVGTITSDSYGTSTFNVTIDNDNNATKQTLQVRVDNRSGVKNDKLEEKIGNGDVINLTGILSQYGDTFQIKPFTLDHFQVVKKADPSQVSDKTYSIGQIQGESHRSPFTGQMVKLQEAVVTYVASDSKFYIQDITPDDNPKTSNGIEVFSRNHNVKVGDKVSVQGSVVEFYGDGYSDKQQTDLTITQISNAKIEVTGTSDVPKPIILGEDIPLPTGAISSDGFSEYNPELYTIDFWESLEGMLVAVRDPRVIGPQLYKEIYVLPAAYDGKLNNAYGLTLQPDSDNPSKIPLLLKNNLVAKSGDYFIGLVDGPVSYSYGNYKVLIDNAILPPIQDGGLKPEVTELKAGEEELSIASYNIENFSANASSTSNEKVARIARSIVTDLNQPDIITLVEMQDNNGTDNNGVVEADKSAQRLIDAIVAAGGVRYEYVDIAPENNQDGGAPGGNIRNGFLYNPNRVQLSDKPKAAANENLTWNNGELSHSIGRVDPTNSVFKSTRKPVVAEFEFLGNKVHVMAVHLNSKRGDSTLYGQVQPAVLGSEPKRHEMAEIIAKFLDEGYAQNNDLNVAILGDFNDFEFTKTMELIEGDNRFNLVSQHDEADRYSYFYRGNFQSLDNIVLSNNLRDRYQFDMVHVNSAFMSQHGRASDHDPLLVVLNFDDTKVAESNESEENNATSPITDEDKPTLPTPDETTPTTPPTTGEDKPTPPTTGAVTPPTGEDKPTLPTTDEANPTPATDETSTSPTTEVVTVLPPTGEDKPTPPTTDEANPTPATDEANPTPATDETSTSLITEVVTVLPPTGEDKPTPPTTDEANPTPATDETSTSPITEVVTVLPPTDETKPTPPTTVEVNSTPLMLSTVYYSEDKAIQIELDAKEADDLNAVIHSVDPSVVAHIKEIGSEVDVYEMYFVDSNQQRYSIEHPAKVTVPIHETDSKKFDTIYYVIPATGAYEDLRDNIVKVEKNDGDVTAVSFEVTHFSYYVVSYKTTDEPTPTSPTTSETPTPPTTGEDKPTPPTTGAVTPPTGETPVAPPTTSDTSTVAQNEETNSDTNATSSTESDTGTLAATDDKQETASEKDDNKVTQDETSPASQPTTQADKAQTTTLPETGEVHDYAIFTSATLAILASVGLIYSKKEEME